MRMQPVVFKWMDVVLPGGGVIRAMVPHPRYAKAAEKQFVDGQEYPMIPSEERSAASHSHYFAAVNEAFKNMPENVADRWLNPQHMRKWALMDIGLYDEKEIEFDTKRDAMRFARHYRNWDMSLPLNERDYSRLFVPAKKINGTFKVIVRTAKSQSRAAMGKQAFEDSKKAVLDYLEAAIGVPTGTLKKEAGKAA